MTTERSDTPATFTATWLFRALVALALFWSITSLTWPFGWDQGIFAWMGDIINQGGIPYRDGWDIKGPLTYYLYAFAGLLFGRNLWGIRLIDLVFTAAAAVALNVLIAKLTAPVVAKWSAVLFVLWLASGSYWHTAQPDGWVSVLTLVAMTPLLVGERTRRTTSLIAAGAIIGCCALIKPFYLMLIALPLLAIIDQSRPHWRRITLQALMVLGGFAVPLLICLGWFASHDALQDLIQIWLTYPIKVYSGLATTTPGWRVRGVIEYLTGGGVIVVLLPMLGLGALTLWRRRKGTAVIVLAWLLIAFLCVILQNKFYLYHWVVIYPPVTVLCSVAFHHILCHPSLTQLNRGSVTLPPYRVLGMCVLLVVIFHTALRPAYEVANCLSYLSGRVSKETYYNRFGIPGADIQAAEYIRARTTADDRVFVWGWNVSITYMSGRRSGSRFGYSMPLIMGEGTAERESCRREFLQSIYAQPPTYIVIAPQSDLILQGHFDLNDFSDLRDFVAQNYASEKVFGELILYRLKSSPA